MKPPSLFDYVCILAIAMLLCFASSGCGTPPSARQRVDSKPIVSAQAGKDAAIISEAAKIDAITPAARPHTDAIRDEIAAAPASEVVRLVASLEDRAKADQKEIAQLRKDLASARDTVDRVIRIGGYALAGILGALAAASLFLAAQVPWLGPRISAALGAASLSIASMVWAYEWTKTHPWITAISGACLLVAAALAYANHLHAKNGQN